ncbi:hypothetical protein HYW18_02535 [Candidatus Uhrbacteria bacterium]|nr:hypothetical protein [Candidatus Uhrbacteria bacterium]
MNAKHFLQLNVALLRLAGIVVLGTSLLAGAFPSVRAATSPPNIITYQGRLLDANGVPVTDANIGMIFEIYNDPTAGTCLWSNNSSSCTSPSARTVTLTDGLFSENLGDTGASPAYAVINDSVFADNAALYLRVTVNGEPLSPRKRLTSSPYALNAENVDGYDTSLTGGTSSFIPITSSSGNLTLTGDPTGTGVSAGVFYLNPTTAAATETLLGLAVNGTQAFRVTGDGDVELIGGITLSDDTEQITIGELTLADNNISADSTLTIDAGDVALNLNTINAVPVNIGGVVNIGDGAGTNALTFEGSSLDAFQTIFAITNPTAVDKTITFKNETGTVAYLSDLTGSSVTLDTAYDAGGSGVGRTITADSGAVAISATSLNGDDLLTLSHTASGSVTADTTDSFQVSTSRTLTAASTITDNFDTASIARTSVINDPTLLGSYTTQGSVLNLSNAVTPTAGTLTDSVNVLSITQDTDSTGMALLVNAGSSAFGGAVVVGQTSLTENIVDAGFAFSGGNDFYVEDLAGFNNDVYIDDQLNVDGAVDFDNTLEVKGHVGVGESTSFSNFAVITATDSIACTSACSLVRGTLTNTTAGFTSNVAGGAFTVTTAQSSGADGGLIGVNGDVATTGTPTLDDDPIIGARGGFSVTSGGPTIADVRGVLGVVKLDSVADITNIATGVGSSVDLSASQTVNGEVDLFYGALTQTLGTLVSANGLALDIETTGGTITTLDGIDVNIAPAGGTITNPRGGVITLNPTTGTFGGNTIGLTLDVSGNNASGNDRTVFGLEVDASTGGTGSPTAYGVYATASGGATNYSGYFYGNLFQVDGNGTPDTNNALATGAGDIYATGDIEADGDIRLDGGNLAVRSTTESVETGITTGLTTGFASVSVSGIDSGLSGGSWQMYTASGAASISNGAPSDLRWTAGGVIALDDDEMRLTAAGELFLDTGLGVGAADVAEVYTIADLTLVEGELVGLQADGAVIRADASTGLLGVVSTSPGVTLNNGENDTFDADERKIALVGRVPVKVNLEGGAIAAGDPIAVSSVAGVGMKATGPGLVLGFALEPYTGIGDRIDVFVNLQWNPASRILADGTAVAVASDFSVSSGDATVLTPVVDSPSLSLRGSAFDGSVMDRSISLQTIVTNTTDYRLSMRDAVGAEIAYVNESGTFSVAGDVIVGDHLYPSDRGVPQTNRYIFYDSSAGPGGDFMRTNASGWATGSYDFAEMFPSTEMLKPGEIVVFAASKESVERSRENYSQKIAGVVSTRPGFLAGENAPGNYPVALAGRVPTFVNDEGGAIEIGDPLTSSSTPGVAMKATKAGTIIGFAMEASPGGVGSIIAFIRPQYWAGPASLAENRASGARMSLSSLDLAGNFYAGGNSMLNVGELSGIGERWKISENGDVTTQGLISTTVRTYQEEWKQTYATTSPEVYITLAGSVELQNGRAHVSFETEDPSFNDVISNQVPVRVVATPASAVAVYVENKNANGFDLVQVGGEQNGVTVDWYAIGYRKDVEPKRYLKLPEIQEEVPPEILEETPEETPEVEESVEPVAEQETSPEVEPELEAPLEPGPELMEVVAEPVQEPTVSPVEEPSEEIPVEMITEEPASASADMSLSEQPQQVPAEQAVETLDVSAHATE